MNNKGKYSYFGPIIASTTSCVIMRQYLELTHFNKLKFGPKLGIVLLPWVILGGAYYKYKKINNQNVIKTSILKPAY